MDDEAMKHQTEMVEGPKAWKRFEGAMRKILAASPAEIQRRIEERRKQVATRSKREGEPPSSPGV
jgi:hypothetical protein